MSQTTKIVAVFKEFVASYPQHFLLLLLLLIFEGVVAGIAVLTLVPLADYIFDPALAKPSKVSLIVLGFLSEFNVSPSFKVFGALFVGSNLIKGILDVTIRYAILRIKYRVLRGMFGDALESFFRARWEFFSNSEQGKLLSTFNKELNTIGDSLGQIATQFAQAFQLLIYLAVPVALNPFMTITAIGLASLFAVPFLMLHKQSYRLGLLNSSTASNALGVLAEILQAARLILSFGRQDQACQRYLDAWDKHTQSTLHSQTLATAIPQLFKPLTMLAAVIAMGISLQSQGNVSELAAVLWSLLAAMPILSNLIQGNLNISNFLPSYEQLVLLRKEAKRYEELPGQKVFTGLTDGILLRNIQFTYPGREITLEDINLELPKGEMIALVGESGSGKSTIVDLVLGLQLPERGEVLLDGIPLQQWHQNSFRQRIGYVQQDPQLFHTSIRENLAWAQENVNEKELWQSLVLANADDFVRALPLGIDTIVGDRGMRLSGGQRQRIALARALLRQPDLLILDEATSALDSESELLIQQSIDNLIHRSTILVIAHRISTITRADQIYVLSKGRVIEKGTYDFLSKRHDSFFGKIARLQSGQDSIVVTK